VSVCGDIEEVLVAAGTVDAVSAIESVVAALDE
jgi:hypothetical protein